MDWLSFTKIVDQHDGYKDNQVYIKYECQQLSTELMSRVGEEKLGHYIISIQHILSSLTGQVWFSVRYCFVSFFTRLILVVCLNSWNQ